MKNKPSMKWIYSNLSSRGREHFRAYRHAWKVDRDYRIQETGSYEIPAKWSKTGNPILWVRG